MSKSESEQAGPVSHDEAELIVERFLRWATDSGSGRDRDGLRLYIDQQRAREEEQSRELAQLREDAERDRERAAARLAEFRERYRSEFGSELDPITDEKAFALGLGDYVTLRGGPEFVRRLSADWDTHFAAWVASRLYADFPTNGESPASHAAFAGEFGLPREEEEQSRELATTKAELAEARARIAELEPRAIWVHWESNGEAGDGQTVCDLCGVETDEPHTVDECRQSIALHIDHGWHVAGQAQDEFTKATARLDALRIVIAKHRDKLSEHASGTGLCEISGWIRKLDEALAAADEKSAGGEELAFLAQCDAARSELEDAGVVLRASDYLSAPGEPAKSFAGGFEMTASDVAWERALSQVPSATGEKECPECTGKLACSRCGVAVAGDYEPGECLDGPDSPENGGTLKEHDQAEHWREVNGCEACNGTGRVPAEEAP